MFICSHVMFLNEQAGRQMAVERRAVFVAAEGGRCCGQHQVDRAVGGRAPSRPKTAGLTRP